MKKIIQLSILFAIAFATSNKSYSQVSGIYEEYGPFKNITSSTYTQIFNREGVKVYARAARGASETNSAVIYFKIENKNSKPAFIDANFKATGQPTKSQFGASSTGGTVPGDRVNPNSYIEIKRYAENMSYVEMLMVTLHAIYLSDKSNSSNAN